ncbi:ABC transporter ATP-binding protein [Acrocarpospora catenulata]|uniref:ABC transporter ATP-binding protein n=1 Tax=Acrocarpospora catenulata TaxID=2836182 RepID=UPI001BD97659|nr:ABC transporter ATP-binding protein [Acrocarpospora catenulata]
MTPTADAPRAEIRDLRIVVRASGEAVVPGIDLTVEAGRIVGLAGETGSGKSTLGLSLLGYVAPGLDVRAGTVRVNGQPVVGEGVQNLRSVRGRTVSYVPQDPSSALNPSLRVGDIVREVMAAHGVLDRGAQRRRAQELFSAVGLPADASFHRRYPHELSGGQKQRVAIAVAFALDPAVVVMDEPTTGLDVSTTRKVVSLVREMSARTGSSVVFVSHDLRLLMSFADRILVMRGGEIVEDVPASRFAEAATHPYSRKLLASLPDTTTLAPRRYRRAGTYALELAAVSARYGKTTATHAVSLRVPTGECLALVGESGSGKTTLARCVAGFHSDYDGDVLVADAVLPRAVERRALAQRRAVQYVFQNPHASLNPRRSVGDSVALAAATLGGLPRRQAWSRAREMVERVGLRADHMVALPHELSGGQCQRMALARALAAQPDVLVCDEVTSSLDVSVQAGIVDLLQDLQKERRLSMLFITHDLTLARVVAENTAVLLDGTVVEYGDSQSVLQAPRHDYTRRLVEAAQATHDQM